MPGAMVARTMAESLTPRTYVVRLQRKRSTYTVSLSREFATEVWWMAVAERQPLSRRRILEEAVRFADREGLEALTMRKLGAELGVEAMSLYNHVPNKSALLDGMVEVLLGEVKVSSENHDWEERIRDGYRAFRRLAHRH